MFLTPFFSDKKLLFCGCIEYWYNMYLYFFSCIAISFRSAQSCSLSFFFPINSMMYDICIMLATVLPSWEISLDQGFVCLCFVCSLDQYMEIFSHFCYFKCIVVLGRVVLFLIKC